jgi:hypothetical protein
MAPPGAAAAATQGAGLLQDVWAHRSSDELRTIIQHGWSAGDDFTCAARELERRSNAMTHSEEQATVTQIAEHKTFVRVVLTLLTAVALGGLLFGMYGG